MSGAMLYTQAFGSRPQNLEVPHIDVRNPTVDDIIFPVGKRWINTAGNTVFSLTSFSYQNLQKIANWTSLAGFQIAGAGSGTLVNSVSVVTNSAITPTSLIFFQYTNFNGTTGFGYVNPSTVIQGQFTLQSFDSSSDDASFYYIVVN